MLQAVLGCAAAAGVQVPVTPEVPGARWVPYSNECQRELYLDEASIRVSDGKVHYRMRTVKLRKDALPTNIVGWSIDCRAQTAFAETMETYDAAGKLVARLVRGDRAREEILAGSKRATLYGHCPAALRRPLPPPAAAGPPMLMSPPQWMAPSLAPAG